MSDQALGRHVLPIPDPAHIGLTTYDAKDPDTAFPPITPLRPPKSAPNVLVILLDDAGFGSSSAFGGPVPHADVRATRRQRASLYTVPHDGAVFTDPAGSADRSQPSLSRHGRDYRDRHVGSRVQLDPAEEQGAAGRDVEAQRLLDRSVRQVSRGARLAEQSDGSVRRLADRRRRVRAFLRFHRGRDQPVGTGGLPRHGAGRARSSPSTTTITSPRTSPTGRSSGSASRSR